MPARDVHFLEVEIGPPGFIGHLTAEPDLQRRNSGRALPPFAVPAEEAHNELGAVAVARLGPNALTRQRLADLAKPENQATRRDRIGPSMHTEYQH